MKLLEERICRDGEVLDGDVLKISSFLNHQVDLELMTQVGVEFKRLSGNEKITKALTCEASGTASGIMTTYQLGVPMVFTRKKKSSTPNDAAYWVDVFSYTKKVNNKIYVEKEFLSSDSHLLIIDDFLAHGGAVKGMLNIAKRADALVAGVGVIVAKEPQGGSDWVREHGHRLEALAKVTNFENNQVRLVEEK